MYVYMNQQVTVCIRTRITYIHTYDFSQNRRGGRPASVFHHIKCGKRRGESGVACFFPKKSGTDAPEIAHLVTAETQVGLSLSSTKVFASQPL
jgi:hypothetical protein